MIAPTSFFVYTSIVIFAITLGIPIAEFVTSTPISKFFLVVIDTSWIGLLFFDAILLPRKKRLKAERTVDKILSQGYRHTIRLEVDLRRGLFNRFKAYLFDDFKEFMYTRGFPHNFSLKAGRNLTRYLLRVDKRGAYKMENVFLTVYGPLRLVKRAYHLPCKTNLSVYPDLKAIRKLSILARTSRMGLAGIRRIQLAGGETEFERLRGFQKDDEIRRIDWKATAKNKSLIVRSYQQSKNQNIFIMLDCGRLMTAASGNSDLLDRSINAALLLSKIALSQGDRVGLIAFSSNVLRYVRPGGSDLQHRKLIGAAYDLVAKHEESNFDLAFRFLQRTHRKRSLLILFTNVVDEANADILLTHLSNLSGKHLPLAVLVSQREVLELLENPPKTKEDLFTQAATADFLLWKENLTRAIRNRGALAIEALPEEMDVKVMNEYLMIKARNLL